MIYDIFHENGIEYFSAIPFSECRLISEELLSRRGIEKEKIKSAVLFLVPYYVDDGVERGISVYARAKDYHIFFDEFYKKNIPLLEEHYGARFYGFADKSAISEVGAAAKAGLGIIGDNFLIINEKYGSFVFIGELLTECSVEELGFQKKEEYKVEGCLHCGACKKSCPMSEGFGCLSALTQRKGEFTKEEEDFILRHGYSWGCDICSLVCPYTKKAVERKISTPIKFFREDRMISPSSKEIEEMEKSEFNLRAFSWRGRKTIVRNLKLFEEKSIQEAKDADK